MKPPYIGVAATMSLSEVAALVDFVEGLDWPSGVRFMNGPLVSHRTLAEEVPTNPARYPSLKLLEEILIDHPVAYNVVHYNGPYPRVNLALLTLESHFPTLEGVQLNMAWPEVASIHNYRVGGGDLDLILQVGARAYREAGSTPTGLVEHLKPYEEAIDYMLFDPSGGLGVPIDLLEATLVLEELTNSGLGIRWGVTGGLNADTVSKLDPLLRLYPDLCWDAESGLRDSSDSLDLDRCKGFLVASAEARRSSRV